MKLSNKVILTDADGVLLDWEYTFSMWMRKHGIREDPNKGDSYELESRFNLDTNTIYRYVGMFNESAKMGYLPPIHNSIKYVKKLHEEHGYIFHVISSCSNDSVVRDLRRQNLERLYGPTVFEEITLLPLGYSKKEYLEPYRDSGCFWVEDHPGHAKTGVDLGLEVFLMKREYNQNTDVDMEHVKAVKDWKEVYNSII